MKIDSRVYDVLKYVLQYVFPGLATLVFALGNIWEFPSEQIVGTITAIETFLGILLGISSKKYYEQMPVDEGEGAEECK